MPSMAEGNLVFILPVTALPYPPDFDRLHVPTSRLNLGLQAFELGA